MQNNNHIDTEIANSFIVVIRSAGERTEQACLHIVHQQLPDENIFVIEEKPFEAAVRKCYEIGIDSGKKWMATIDADVLPTNNAIKSLFNLSKKMNEKIIMFNGVIYDKLLLTHRSAGIKVYQIQNLSKIIDFIPEAGSQIRPEAFTLRQAAAIGLEKKYTGLVTGIHDYEQFYCDIYRTSFLHANKHNNVKSLINEWQKLSRVDADYRMAIKGALDGFLFPDIATTDSRVYSEMAEKALDELSLTEKPKHLSGNIENMVSSILKDAGPYMDNKKFLNKLRLDIKNKGTINGIRCFIASCMEKAGAIIRPSL